MRAPPESFSPITGAPTFIAWSMILQIFSACASDSEPPNTVKSWLNTNTRRPLIVPEPVTTPSPGTRCSAMPNSVQRCSTNTSISSNEPRSSSSSSRSRADSLPRWCWAAIRFAPPPAWAALRLASSCSRISRTDRTSATPARVRGGWRCIAPAPVASKRAGATCHGRRHLLALQAIRSRCIDRRRAGRRRHGQRRSRSIGTAATAMGARRSLGRVPRVGSDAWDR